MNKLILIAALAVFSLDLMAGEIRAVSCDGCSSSQRYQKAVRTIDSGKVYVFNASNARVYKYKVHTELVDSYPYTEWTEAVEVRAEYRLRKAYREYIRSSDSLLEEGRIQLPADFPVKSVAGALLDPGYASTSIEDFLLQQSVYRQLENNLSTLIARVLKAKIPGIDLQLLVDELILTVEFPDGSTMDFVASVSFNTLSGEAKMELNSYGNARLENGKPAPTSLLGFRSLVLNDYHGSLFEWINYARSFGITIGGLPGGGTNTSMECLVAGSVIKCTVVYIAD